MSIIIIGLGAAGRHYLKLLKHVEKNVFVLDKKKIHSNRSYKLISFNEIIKENIKFDYAIIASPSGLHYEHASFFLKRGSNVLIEKPFVLKLSHAKSLISLSKKHKVKCWTSLQNRYNLATSHLNKEIKEKTIGEIVMVDCTMIWSRSKKYYSTAWRGNYKTDGGVLTNQAIHLLDTLLYNFGEISSFNAIASFNKKKLDAEDLIAINFKHKNGTLSNFKATTRADNDYRSAIDVIGTNGRIIVKGISLNTFNKFKKKKLINFKRYSEQFKLGIGPISGMGFGHKKLLYEFLNKNKSSKDLEIEKNYYLLKVIHSVYNSLFKTKKIDFIKDTNSLLGK